MWKTATVSAALAAVLTIAIGAGVIRATSDGGSAATPPVETAAQGDRGDVAGGRFQPPMIPATLNTGPAARPAAETDTQGHDAPATPSDPADTGDEPPAATGGEDMWQHMEDMHDPEHIEAMREHMDAVHDEGAFESMLDHMGGGMMGDASNGGMMGGGMMGGGMMGGGSGSGMMGGGGLGGSLSGGITGGGFGGGMMSW